jgi:hypothetical protein
MTLTIELTPEQEAALQAQAGATDETRLMNLLADLEQMGQRISQSMDTMNADLREMVAMARGLR